MKPARPRLSSALRILLSALALFALLFATRPAFAEPIRLWHAMRGDEEKALEEILARWKGAPVEPLALPYDAMKSKLTAAIPLGEGPDLFIDAHNRLGDYRNRKVVAPVGDALEANAYGAPTLAAVTVDGQAYGVPISQKSVALFVNTDLVKEVPEDLEGIAALAGKLPPGVFPLAYEANGLYVHSALLGAFGGTVLGPDDSFSLASPAAERSLDFALGLLAKKAIPEEADGALVTQLFRSGKAAFAISGPWLAADLGGAAGLHYRVAPLPKVRETGEFMKPLLTVEAIMMSPKGAARAEVRELSRLLASAEAAHIRAERARTLPARLDAPLPEGDEFLRAFAEQAKRAIPMPTSTAMDAVWEPANKAIRKIMRRDALPGPALAEAKRRFDDVRRPLPEPAKPAPAIVVVGLVLLAGAFALLRRARDPEFGPALRRSMPAYAYCIHTLLAIGVLVLVPLMIGAGTSLFAGRDESLRYVGLANFWNILTARGGPLLASGSFYVVLLVTVVWTLVNVFFHVAIGVALALLLSRPTLRLRALYRVLLIVPWAVPSYVTALAWKGMFHRQFGAVTGLILGLDHAFGLSIEPIAWFSRFSTAFAANVTTNVWLGFPFMMVVTLGALTGVPDDVLEAAKVDGASRWQRLWLVTLPMIRPTLTPAVTMGAIWTFNMFNVVFLVSGGDPDGTTEILVSEAYRWAFTREAQYGYAAAYSVLIFLLLFGWTRMLDFLKAREQKKLAAPAPAPAITEAA
jgi:arabinogalactan oligomer/maltooligosaccharide transport system permease protein